MFPVLSDTSCSFFILDPAGSKDPLLLVPTVQFKGFLDFANARLGRNLTIPRGPAQAKFFLTFGVSGTPRPRFLGDVSSWAGHEDLRNKAKCFAPDNLGDLSAGAIRAFKEIVRTIYNSINAEKKQKKNPEVERMKRIERQKESGRVTKRVQRYLGLRARAAYASRSGAP